MQVLIGLCNLRIENCLFFPLFKKTCAEKSTCFHFTTLDCSEEATKGGVELMGVCEPVGAAHSAALRLDFFLCVSTGPVRAGSRWSAGRFHMLQQQQQRTLFLLSFLCFLVTPASFLFLPVAALHPDSVHCHTSRPHFSIFPFFQFLSTVLSTLKTHFAYSSIQITKVVCIYFTSVFGLLIPQCCMDTLCFSKLGPACSTLIGQDHLKTLNIVPGTFWL